MTTMTDTTRARLERAFEMLKNQDIIPILVLTGSTGSLQSNLKEYHWFTFAVCNALWAGAHAGSEHTGGGHWVDGGLYHKATGHPIGTLWFSVSGPEVADALVAELEAEGFTAELVGAEVRLLLSEEN